MQEQEHPQSTVCRICKNPINDGGWGGGECPICGSVSALQLPSEEAIEAHYRSDNPTYTGGGRNLTRYAKWYLDACLRHRRGGTLLDIGSATSPFPNLAQAAGFQVTVMDFVRPPGLADGVVFQKGSLNLDGSAKNLFGKFDVVTAWAVIEHVADPETAVRIIANCCSRNGVILLTTPEIGTSLTDYSLGHSGWFDPPGHLHLISPGGIARLFNQNGCELINWRRMELNPIRWIARYGIGLSETCLGIPVWIGCRPYWRKWRNGRLHRFRGITSFVLRRT